MAKRSNKKSSKKRVKHSQPANKGKRVEEENQAPEAENEYDFGGLPNRDLKKNLGCG